MSGEEPLAGKTVADAVSHYGASTKSKLADAAISGAPEDQLRGPLEALVRDLAELAGLPTGSVHLIGETTLSDIKTRPDFAVTVSKALVGFIEVKAPGKGADPRKFNDPHDKDQWEQTSNHCRTWIYTDGNAFSLWRDGKIEGAIVHLEGNVETVGREAARRRRRLFRSFSDFLRLGADPQRPQSSSLRSARGSAGCCVMKLLNRWRSIALRSPASRKTGESSSFRKRMMRSSRMATRRQ